MVDTAIVQPTTASRATSMSPGRRDCLSRNAVVATSPARVCLRKMLDVVKS
jgi:hypothetical protein